MIRLALTGASGTGKSTIASHVAEHLSIPFCPVGSRSVAKDMGFNNPYDVDAAGRRVEFQRRLLSSKLEWELERQNFVTDRAYIDNLAYAMTHAPETASPVFIQSIRDASRIHTHIVFCPISAFHHVGNDPARVPELKYHLEYERLLISLIGQHIRSAPVLWLTSPSHEERLEQVEKFLRS